MAMPHKCRDCGADLPEGAAFQFGGRCRGCRFPEKLGPDRVNFIRLCKAAMLYAEGPGDVDALLRKAIGHLGECVVLMRSAHIRALEEQAAQEKAQARRSAARPHIPAIAKASASKRAKEVFERRLAKGDPAALAELRRMAEAEGLLTPKETPDEKAEEAQES